MTVIAMWSGPRNISTAMMYAFASRPRTIVWDEPFYAHYLHETGITHPMGDAVIAAGEDGGAAVLVYLAAYTLMNIGAFAAVALMSVIGEVSLGIIFRAVSNSSSDGGSPLIAASSFLARTGVGPTAPNATRYSYSGLTRTATLACARSSPR